VKSQGTDGHKAVPMIGKNIVRKNEIYFLMILTWQIGFNMNKIMKIKKVKKISFSSTPKQSKP